MLLAVTFIGLAIPFSIMETSTGLPYLVIEALYAGAAWTISVLAARILVDKRRFTGLGVVWGAHSAKSLLQGIGFAAGMITMIFGIEWAGGWIEIERFGWEAVEGSKTGDIASWLFLFLLVGWYEELYFRGYLFTNLAEGLNQTWALILSTVLFSASHIANPNSSSASMIGILAAGTLLGYAYIRTKNLWLPIGIHIGWNVFEGVVYGFPVSGLKTAAFVQQTQSGPEILTGGSFGPEAGMLQIPALLLGIWLVHLVTKKKTHGGET